MIYNDDAVDAFFGPDGLEAEEAWEGVLDDTLTSLGILTKPEKSFSSRYPEFCQQVRNHELADKSIRNIMFFAQAKFIRCVPQQRHYISEFMQGRSNEISEDLLRQFIASEPVYYDENEAYRPFLFGGFVKTVQGGLDTCLMQLLEAPRWASNERLVEQAYRAYEKVERYFSFVKGESVQTREGRILDPLVRRLAEQEDLSDLLWTNDLRTVEDVRRIVQRAAMMQIDGRSLQRYASRGHKPLVSYNREAVAFEIARRASFSLQLPYSLTRYCQWGGQSRDRRLLSLGGEAGAPVTRVRLSIRQTDSVLRQILDFESKKVPFYFYEDTDFRVPVEFAGYRDPLLQSEDFLKRGFYNRIPLFEDKIDLSVLALERECRSYEELLRDLDEVSELYLKVEVTPRSEESEEAYEEEFLELEDSLGSSEFEELVRAWTQNRSPDPRITEGPERPPDEGDPSQPLEGDGVVRDETYYTERANTSIYDQRRALIEQWQNQELLCQEHRQFPLSDEFIRQDCPICALHYLEAQAETHVVPGWFLEISKAHRPEIEAGGFFDMFGGSESES